MVKKWFTHLKYAFIGLTAVISLWLAGCQSRTESSTINPMPEKTILKTLRSSNHPATPPGGKHIGADSLGDHKKNLWAHQRPRGEMDERHHTGSRSG
jgi:hypothetical protein